MREPTMARMLVLVRTGGVSAPLPAHPLLEAVQRRQDEGGKRQDRQQAEPRADRVAEAA
jgi:hypothetical protein